MKLKIYQIDAFTDQVFKGNPAAVCPLEDWLPDQLMQQIAAENNLSETTFFVVEGDQYHIRWFTPLAEVDLCGHATVAAAYVLFNELGCSESSIQFTSRSGLLSVARDGALYQLDFPAQPADSCPAPKALLEAFKLKTAECFAREDYILLLPNAEQVKCCNPDLALLKKLDLRGVIVTSTDDTYDFIARFFAPKYGVPEDPVTGSAYTQLVPLWHQRLRIDSFRAYQCSSRGGELYCQLKGDRVTIAGMAVKYLEGIIEI